jgi:hypothetical protein
MLISEIHAPYLLTGICSILHTSSGKSLQFNQRGRLPSPSPQGVIALGNQEGQERIEPKSEDPAPPSLHHLSAWVAPQPCPILRAVIFKVRSE